MNLHDGAFSSNFKAQNRDETLLVLKQSQWLDFTAVNFRHLTVFCCYTTLSTLSKAE